MEKYTLIRDQLSDVSNRMLSDIYRDVTYRRQMTATRVENVRADLKKINDAPVWRGDHTFNSDAAKYSFLNFIEPEVAQKHPDWSKQKIRKEALTKFQQRLEQDLSYEQKESSHQETAVQWKVVETQPGKQELATEYGGETITLRQLWDHTREYAVHVGIPSAYNPDEEQAQYAMEQAFVKGDAQAYISVLSHPDAVRYVQVWERDDSGGIQSKQIDLYKTTGRDFSHIEGDMLVKHLAAFTESVQGQPVVTTESKYAHFIVKSGSVYEQDIRTIAIVQASVRRDEHRIQAGLPIKHEESPRPILGNKESQNTFSDMQSFITEAINKKIAQMQEKVSVENKKQSAKAQKPSIHIENKDNESHIGNLGTSQVRNETQVNPKIETSYETSPITDVLAGLVIAKTATTFGGQIPEVSGGALYILASLSEKTSESIKSEQLPKPQIISEAMFSIMRSVRVFFEKGNEVFLKIHRSHVSSNVDLVIEQHLTSENINQEEGSEKEIGFIEQIVVYIKESGMVGFFTVLKEFAKRMQKAGKLTEVNILQTPVVRSTALEFKEVSLDIEKPTVHAMFGIFYWIFLSYNKDLPSNKSRSESIASSEIDAKHNKHDQGPAHNPPWILLSIIWHLTMLREAAMATQAPQGVQVAQALDPAAVSPSVVSTIPMSGVIFPSSFVLE